MAIENSTLPISAIILTFNEEKNIENCLLSIKGFAQEIFIVDSYSSDRTLEIARNYTDKIYQHPFEIHAKQWNWAFRNLPLSNEWCFPLDADQVIPGKLQDELRQVFQALRADINGFYINRRQYFRGKWIIFGGYYPKYLLKLFKVKASRCDERELVDHRFYVQGKIGKLKHCIIEDNRNEDNITFWLEKHLRFATLKAQEISSYRKKRRSWLIKPALLGSDDQRVLWLKDLYYTLPLYIRPFLYFFFRFFILLGFLDGARGFLFHFLQGFWYRLIIDTKIAELEKQ